MTTTTKTATTGDDRVHPGFPHRHLGETELCNIRPKRKHAEQPSDPAELGQGHSPLPWSTAWADHQSAVLSQHAGVALCGSTDLAHKNATYIVLCVNTHATLVAALEQALRWFDARSELVDSAQDNGVRDEVSHALNQARGGE